MTHKLNIQDIDFIGVDMFDRVDSYLVNLFNCPKAKENDINLLH